MLLEENSDPWAAPPTHSTGLPSGHPLHAKKTWKLHPVTTQSSQFLFDKTLKLLCGNTSDHLCTTIFFQTELLALHLNIKNKYNTFIKMSQQVSTHGLTSAALPFPTSRQSSSWRTQTQPELTPDLTMPILVEIILMSSSTEKKDNVFRSMHVSTGKLKTTKNESFHSITLWNTVLLRKRLSGKCSNNEKNMPKISTGRPLLGSKPRICSLLCAIQKKF